MDSVAMVIQVNQNEKQVYTHACFHAVVRMVTKKEVRVCVDMDRSDSERLGRTFSFVDDCVMNGRVRGMRWIRMQRVTVE